MLSIKLNRMNNEEGSAILIALLVLAAVTVIGFTSSNVSLIEQRIVQNEQIGVSNFYLSESAALESLQWLDLAQNPEDIVPFTTPYPWLNDVGTWDFSVSGVWDTVSTPNASVSTVDPTAAKYAVNMMGTDSKSTLSLNATRVYKFEAFGLSEQSQSEAIIQVGYNKRL